MTPARIGAAVCAVLFTVASFFLLRMEFAQAHLKTGKRLYKENNTLAVPALEQGVAADPSDYLLRYHLAKSYQRLAYSHTLGTPEAQRYLLKGMQQARQALNLRVDGFTYTLMGDIQQARGEVYPALGYFHIGYFLMQDTAQLARWAAIRPRQDEAAAWFWNNGQPGVALAIGFNRLAGFAPYWQPDKAGRVVADWFEQVPPQEWFTPYDGAELAKRKEIVKQAYDRLPENERKAVEKRFAANSLGFLNLYLEGGDE